MDDFVGIVIGKIILEYIGGIIRFLFGTLWNKILKKTNNTYYILMEKKI